MDPYVDVNGRSTGHWTQPDSGNAEHQSPMTKTNHGCSNFLSSAEGLQKLCQVSLPGDQLILGGHFPWFSTCFWSCNSVKKRISRRWVLDLQGWIILHPWRQPAPASHIPRRHAKTSNSQPSSSQDPRSLDSIPRNTPIIKRRPAREQMRGVSNSDDLSGTFVSWRCLRDLSPLQKREAGARVLDQGTTHMLAGPIHHFSSHSPSLTQTAIAHRQRRGCPLPRFPVPRRR